MDKCGVRLTAYVVLQAQLWRTIFQTEVNWDDADLWIYGVVYRWVSEYCCHFLAVIKVESNIFEFKLFQNIN